MWFTELTGVAEESPDQVRENLDLQGSTITSRVNGRKMEAGTLRVPTLANLRGQLPDFGSSASQTRLKIQEVVGDVQKLHASEENAGAMFQVASQFNLLEMISPSVTPEDGINIYSNDATQGPACAIAAGAGTIFGIITHQLTGKSVNLPVPRSTAWLVWGIY